MCKTFVIDNGTRAIKAGFAGKEPKQYRHINDNVIVRGNIEDWDNLCDAWQNIFSEHGIQNFRETNLVVLRNPYEHLVNRKTIAEIMLEQYGFNSIGFAIAGLSSLHALNKTSGMVLSVGHGISHVVPVFEGYVVSSAVERIYLGGQDTIKHAIEHTGINQRKIEKMQERTSFLADRKFRRMHDVLCNVLFGSVCETNIVQMIQKSIDKCDMSLRKTMIKNICLSGGLCAIPGFDEKIEAELIQTCFFQPITSSTTEPWTLDWYGASLLNGQEFFTSDDRWVYNDKLLK